MRFPRSFARVVLMALGLVLAASVAAAFRGERPSQIGRLTLPPPLPREWRWEPRTLNLDFMYGQPEHPPLKMEDMYAKRRLPPQ